MRRVLVTGITGQDGGYLTEQLLAEGSEVHGFVLAGDPAVLAFAEEHPSVVLHAGDLADSAGVAALVNDVEPDELYNFAGISSVAFSWEHPVLTAELSGVAAAVLFRAALEVQERTGRRVSCVQASSTSTTASGSRCTRPSISDKSWSRRASLSRPIIPKSMKASRMPGR